MLEKKVVENYVFDENTHKALFKLARNNVIDAIDSPIASGKEAITFLGHLKDNPLVAKIYKVEASKFKNMSKYILGDYRFKNVSKDRYDVFLVWAKKEYKNLCLAKKYGVSCPIVIGREKNIIIMSFIGKDSEPFPRLKDVREIDTKKVYEQIIDNYAKLLYGAGLVHADFSAYNILINIEDCKITFIDFGQAVVTAHPKAKEFLKADIINITDFLNKKDKKLQLTYDKMLSDLKIKKEELYGRNSESRI